MCGMNLQRVEPPVLADERTTLAGFLQFQRDTLEMKCAGLTAEQLKLRAVPPSELSLLGLVQHLIDVERGWFREVMAGEGSRARSPHGPSTFDVETAGADEVLAFWRAQCAASRAVVDAAESLDATGVHHRRGTVSLRYVLAHMIEEYARHNGHADLLRERIDGVTGE
jgi:uncharacterized damage-inducible protein DinB